MPALLRDICKESLSNVFSNNLPICVFSAIKSERMNLRFPEEDFECNAVSLATIENLETSRE